MSAFAMLLNEARDLVRARMRAEVRLHFDWDGTTGPESWACWADGCNEGKVYRGSAGEEALRRLVDGLR